MVQKLAILNDIFNQYRKMIDKNAKPQSQIYNFFLFIINLQLFQASKGFFKILGQNLVTI